MNGINLNSIQKIQICECLKSILQARHDATMAEERANISENNEAFWDEQANLASIRLNANLLQLSEIFGIPEILELLID